MDLKVGCERILTLCQGCLSADRNLRRITGQNRALFIKLREDDKKSDDDAKELRLCFECYALLNKMKNFQARIKTAQYKLMRYLHTFYNKDEIPHTLSTLIKTNHKSQYDYKYKFNHEEEQRLPIHEQNDQIFVQKDQIFEQKDQILDQKETTDTESLIIGIKLENNDSTIKEEYEDISNDNDADYYEPELKLERDEDYKIVERKPNKTELERRSIKSYEQYATVTKNIDFYATAVGLYSMTVFLTEKEVEVVLERDRRSNKNGKMPFRCRECSLGYKKRLDLLRHKTFHHSTLIFPTTCKACKCLLHTESQLEEHWKDCHTSMLQCSMCSELSRSKGEMRKHLNRTHTKTYTCNNCQLEFRTLREFSNHYKRTHEKVVCDYCNSRFSSKRRLESHIKRNHLPACCSVCQRTYKTYSVFENHIRTQHPELMSCDTRKEMCYCVECDKQYPSIYKYRRHLQQSARHTPRKKLRVPCPDCDKIFTRTTYMNNHYRLVHIKESKHYCDLCNKYFATGYGVRKHIQFVHQKIPLPKDKICELCGRGFSTNRILTNHRRTHTGERPFKCPYCPSSFAQDIALKSHQRTQHKNSMLLPS